MPMDVFEQTYDRVLADTVAALPKVRLVLCTPFTLPVDPSGHKNEFAPWDADVKERAQIIVKLATKKLPVLIGCGMAFTRTTPVTVSSRRSGYAL